MSTDLYQVVHRSIVHRIRSKMDIHTTLKDALLRSDVGKQRVCLMAKNLTEKIKTEPHWFVIDQAKLEMLVWSFTDMFVHTFKVVSDQKAMSDFNKEKIKAEADKFKGLDANGNGYVEELGIKVVDSGGSSGNEEES